MMSEYQIGALSALFGGSGKKSQVDFTDVIKNHKKNVNKVLTGYDKKELNKSESRASRNERKRKFTGDSDGRPILETGGERTSGYMEKNGPKKSVPSPVEDSPEKKARTLFVGNLPLSFKKKAFKKLFKEYGKVESVRFRSAVPEIPSISKKAAIITKKFHSQSNHINGYVVMENKEGAASALALNGSVIQEHRIRVDFTENKLHNHKLSVFVGNMPYDTQEDEVWELFQDCGNVKNVRIIRDRASGVGKGFGYVLLDTEDEVMLALQKEGQELRGRCLRVTHAKSDVQMKKIQKKKSRGGPENTAIDFKRGQRKKVFSNTFQGFKGKEGRKMKKKVIKKIRHPRQRNKKNQDD